MKLFWIFLVVFATLAFAQIPQGELQSFIQEIPQKVGKTPLRIAVGKVVYKDSKLFGDLSQQLREKMIDIAEKESSLRLVMTRGLRVKGYHVIEASYSKNTIVVYVKDPQKNIVMQKTWTWEVAEPGLPENASEVEEVLEDWEPPATARRPELALQMTTNKGNAEGVFYHEEKLFLEIKASKDCYLYIFYRQADGSVLQIFPNNFHGNNQIIADRIYTIPDKNYTFDFEVDTSEIHGLEVIHAVASLEPMAQVPGVDVMEGMRALKVKPRNAIEICRNNKETAEVTCTIYTKKGRK